MILRVRRALRHIATSAAFVNLNSASKLSCKADLSGRRDARLGADARLERTRWRFRDRALPNGHDDDRQSRGATHQGGRAGDHRRRALNQAGATQEFTYVSTAGGAFLEWLEGKQLPGVEALRRSSAQTRLPLGSPGVKNEPSVTPGRVSRDAVREIGERLTEAPSDRIVDIAFARELKAQLGLTHVIGWVDLAHTMCLGEQGVIPP
jgi:Phosphoglycerate kinase